jgi:mono/diheme cytochrome c family protein
MGILLYGAGWLGACRHREGPPAWPAHFGFGHAASQREMDSMSIAVRPDGQGLPSGSGDVPAGRVLYAEKCAACHGLTGREGPEQRLVGPMGDTTKAKTIGNYWPYATTVFDYIRRAMPKNAPGSLDAHEVYSLTAYLLNANRIIDSTAVMNAVTLPRVAMPAKPYFVPDDRTGGPVAR